MIKRVQYPWPSITLLFSSASFLAPGSQWVVSVDKRRGSILLSPYCYVFKVAEINGVQYPFCLALFLDCLCHVHHFSNCEQWTYRRLCTKVWTLVGFISTTDSIIIYHLMIEFIMAASIPQGGVVSALKTWLICSSKVEITFCIYDLWKYFPVEKNTFFIISWNFKSWNIPDSWESFSDLVSNSSFPWVFNFWELFPLWRKIHFIIS